MIQAGSHKLTISVASEISYLKPKNQEALLHLIRIHWKRVTAVPPTRWKTC